MSTQDFLARSAFNDLANSIEQALSDTEGFRDEAENFADLARRGIRLVPPGVVADLSSFPSNPEGGDAVLVESEDQIYFFDSDSSTWKDSKIIGSAIFANIQGDPSDNTALQAALDEKADTEDDTWTPTDGSGEGLTLTVDTARYVMNGKLVTIAADVTYPTTSGTRNAVISGIPFNHRRDPIWVNSLVSVGSTDPDRVQVSGGDNNSVFFRKRDGTLASNADMSGLQIRFSLTYKRV